MAGEDTASSGWLETGTKFLSGLTEAYGTYERAKGANDMEYPSYDNYNPQPTSSGAAVPSWVWIVAGLGVAFVAVRMAR